MDARRRRWLLLGLLLLLVAGAYALRRGPGSPSVVEQSGSDDAVPAGDRVPILAVARRGDRDRSAAPATDPKGDASAASAVEERPTSWTLGSDVDDPALPEERVPLAVTLVDPAGRPVPRAAVHAVWGEWRTKTYTADREGRVTMSVPRGARALEVVGMPRGETRRFLLLHYHALVGNESETRVVVRVGAEIAGRLVGRDGAPIADRKIVAVPTAFGFGPATTDADGAFRLGALEGTYVDVEALGPVFEGFLLNEGDTERGSTGRFGARARRVAAGTKDLVLIDEALAGGGRLSVRVVGADGDPVPKAIVSIPGFLLPRFEGRTDASGRLAVGDLPRWPATVDVYEAASDGSISPFTRQTFDHLEPDGAEVELRLTPAPRTALKGRVLDAMGKPVVGAWCAACSGSAYLASFATDAEGHFATTVPVEPGSRFQLSARFPMQNPLSRGVLDDVVAGATEPTIVLEEIGPLESPSRRGSYDSFTKYAGRQNATFGEVHRPK